MFVFCYENPLYLLPVVSDVLQKQPSGFCCSQSSPNEAHMKGGAGSRNQFRLTLVAHSRHSTMMNGKKGSFTQMASIQK